MTLAVLLLPTTHNGSYNHFRRPGTAENKALTVENKLFSAALDLFSEVPGRQKKLVKNKPLFWAARDPPPKIGYFGRPAAQLPKIIVDYRRLIRGRRKSDISGGQLLIFGGLRWPPKINNFGQKIEKMQKITEISSTL
jgi:hypothetical protein